MAESSVRAIRERLGMSQSRFAATFGLNLTTLRQWEQGRCRPDGAARVLLMVVERAPNVVSAVVSGTLAEAG
jgi:putative transcriptional regulator